MGRWIKIYGDEQPTNTPRGARVLDRMERVVAWLEMNAFATKKPLTEKQHKTLFAYGITLQSYGRMRYLNRQETLEFDRRMTVRFLRMLDYKGPIAEFEKTTEGDELDQYVKSLPKRYHVWKKP